MRKHKGVVTVRVGIVAVSAVASGRNAAAVSAMATATVQKVRNAMNVRKVAAAMVVRPVMVRTADVSQWKHVAKSARPRPLVAMMSAMPARVKVAAAATAVSVAVGPKVPRQRLSRWQKSGPPQSLQPRAPHSPRPPRKALASALKDAAVVVVAVAVVVAIVKTATAMATFWRTQKATMSSLLRQKVKAHRRHLPISWHRPQW